MVEIPPMSSKDWKTMLDSMSTLKQSQDFKPLPETPVVNTAALDFPPGNAGQVARFIHSAAMRPVKEVAIVGALGLLAGICGRQWQIPKSGLNVYIILVARSAIGKEAMHDGVSMLIKACAEQLPTCQKFVDFTEYASGPALTKACVGNPCFVNVSGEIGKRIKAMATAKTGDAMSTLRTQMTNLYHKSSPSSTVGGIGYSATDNNVASVSGVSYSLIGETTPGTFLESLTSDMMEDGFMSRLTVIEYDGKRPAPNQNPAMLVPQELKQWLLPLITQADLLAGKNRYQSLYRSDGAHAKMDAFERECDTNINSTDDESRRQMWNRANLKALRIAGLLAVADNYITPVISDDHIDWAIGLVRRDIATFTKRLDGGDVGSGDNACHDKLVAVLKHYLIHEIPDSYKIPDAMRQNSIVPHNYLLQRTRNHSAFYGHRLGTNRALGAAIYAMIDNGYLMEVQKDKVVEAYSFQGKAYRVVKLPQ